MTQAASPDSARHDKALLTLLGDSSPVVRAGVREEIVRMGEEGLELLRHVCVHAIGEPVAVARTWLRELGGPAADAALLDYIASQRYELLSGMMLIDRAGDPSTTYADYALLETIVDAATPALAGIQSHRGRCSALSACLFGSFGFVPATEDILDPSNSFLCRTLRRHRGTPLSLCAVYALVGARLGLSLEPISMPERFMLGCFEEDEPFFIDCFQGGRHLSAHDVFTFLRAHGHDASPTYLMPSPVGEVLCRVCRNLVNQYRHEGDPVATERFRSFVSAFRVARGVQAPRTLGGDWA